MGGYDLIFQYAHYTANVPAPPWAWLIGAPFGLLPYPLMWYAWIAVSIVIVGLSVRAFGHDSLRESSWPVLFSISMIANLWYGQLEAFVLLGVALGWLVIVRRAHPALMGAAWLLMLLKPQVTLIPAILFALWLWQDDSRRESGRRAVAWAVATAVAIFMASLAAYPSWIGDIGRTLRTYSLPSPSASIFPFGLLSLPCLLLPAHRLARLRIALAVNLLCSPYFWTYHMTTFLAVTGSGILAALTWLPLAANVMRFSWIVPVAFLVAVAAKEIILWFGVREYAGLTGN